MKRFFRPKNHLQWFEDDFQCSTLHRLNLKSIHLIDNNNKLSHESSTPTETNLDEFRMDWFSIWTSCVSEMFCILNENHLSRHHRWHIDNPPTSYLIPRKKNPSVWWSLKNGSAHTWNWIVPSHRVDWDFYSSHWTLFLLGFCLHFMLNQGLEDWLRKRSF